MSIVIPLKKMPAVLRKNAERLPTLIKELKTELVRSVWHDPVVSEQARDTGTLQASTGTFAGKPQGRTLERAEGHPLVPESELDAVAAASAPFQAIGLAQDARKNGEPYGIYVEAKNHVFTDAHRSLPRHYPRALARAIKKAIKS